jgi:nicotinamidase-related amidase
LTPQNAGLIVIDVQERLLAAMPKREATIAGVDRLLRAARILKVPAILTLQYVKGLGPLCAELNEAARDLPVIEKMAFSCCGSPEFAEHWKSMKRPRAILCGVEAHVCVKQTALELIERGQAVYIVSDAVCSRRPEDESVALERMRSSGAVVTTVEALVFELLKEAGTPQFKQILPLFKSPT